MSSQMGSVGYSGRVAYCATKHAVDGLTKALAVEWAREGIRVNAVAPTFVLTPLTEGYLEDPGVPRRGAGAAIADRAAGRAPRRRSRGALPGARRLAERHRPLLKVDGGWTAW